MFGVGVGCSDFIWPLPLSPDCVRARPRLQGAAVVDAPDLPGPRPAPLCGRLLLNNTTDTTNNTTAATNHDGNDDTTTTNNNNNNASTIVMQPSFPIIRGASARPTATSSAEPRRPPARWIRRPTEKEIPRQSILMAIYIYIYIIYIYTHTYIHKYIHRSV